MLKTRDLTYAHFNCGSLYLPTYTYKKYKLTIAKLVQCPERDNNKKRVQHTSSLPSLWRSQLIRAPLRRASHATEVSNRHSPGVPSPSTIYQPCDTTLPPHSTPPSPCPVPGSPRAFYSNKLGRQVTSRPPTPRTGSQVPNATHCQGFGGAVAVTGHICVWLPP